METKENLIQRIKRDFRDIKQDLTGNPDAGNFETVRSIVTLLREQPLALKVVMAIKMMSLGVLGFTIYMLAWAGDKFSRLFPQA